MREQSWTPLCCSELGTYPLLGDMIPFAFAFAFLLSLDGTRYWQDNQSQADNASVIILKFFQSDSPGEGELPHPSQEHVEAQSDTTQP